MLLLNFSHPLTLEQLQRIRELIGQVVARVIEMPIQLDHEQPFAEQVRELADGIGLSPEQWRMRSLLIRNVEDVVSAGDEVAVRVKEVDVNKQRISLSMKGIEQG